MTAPLWQPRIIKRDPAATAAIRLVPRSCSLLIGGLRIKNQPEWHLIPQLQLSPFTRDLSQYLCLDNIIRLR